MFIVVFLILTAIVLLAIFLKTKLRTKTVNNDSTHHVFEMGNMQVEIDPQRMRITREIYSCDISLRDLKLLTCLYEHPDEVLTKDKLYNAGWGRDFLPNSRSLEQHIVTLRKKIDPDRSRTPLIVTVHGLGYKHPAESL